MFVPAKKGEGEVGKTKRGKGTKIMLAVEGKGLPIGLLVTSATPHESKLIAPLLDSIRVSRIGAGRPRARISRLSYDKAADCFKPRCRLMEDQESL